MKRTMNNDLQPGTLVSTGDGFGVVEDFAYGGVHVKARNGIVYWHDFESLSVVQPADDASCAVNREPTERKDDMNTDPIDKSQRLDTLDSQGVWVYPSAAESGHVEIELPTLPGSPDAVERLHVRDFGAHVAGKIENRMKENPYLRSGPQQSPPQIFRHYTAVAKGACLMDEGALKRMEQLAGEFEAKPNRQDYFEQVLRPYLHSLSPKPR